jgi:tetratricopeptide (TPR) repeat protein
MCSLWKIAHSVIVSLFIAGIGVSVPAQSYSINQTSPPLTADRIVREAKPKDPATFQKTITAYKAALRSAPDSPLLLNNIGVEYALAKQYLTAASHLEKAVSTDPSKVSYLVNLATVYIHLDRTTEAWALLDRATRVDPGNLRARKALCDLLAGGTDQNETVRCYETLQIKESLDPVSAANFGSALAKAGKKERAVQILEDAAVRFRSSYWILNALGMIHFRSKDYKLAAESFKRAVELDPERFEFRFNLAICQLASGNKPGAISQYNFLAEKDPKLAFELYKQIYGDKVVFVGKR